MNPLLQLPARVSSILFLAPALLGQPLFDALGDRSELSQSMCFGLATADIDSDGDVDVALSLLGSSGPRLVLFENDGRGLMTVVDASRLPAGGVPGWSLAFADVDGDGDADLLVAGSAGDRLLLNDGRGSFTDATASHLPALAGSHVDAVFADLDGDGDLDLVCAAGSVPLRLYRNLGDGRFTDESPTWLPFAPGDARALAVGDVDGDGDRDLVVGVGGDVDRLYLNDGHGRFAEAAVGRLPTGVGSTNDVVLADLDADGDLDVVVANGSRAGMYFCGYGVPERSRLYVNDGTGAFRDASHQLPDGGTATEQLLVGDVDGDGDPDLVAVDYGGGIDDAEQRNAVFLNDGAGHFVDRTDPLMPTTRPQAKFGALADLDGDGDLDLVLGGACFLGARIDFNLLRQLSLAAGSPTRGGVLSLRVHARNPALPATQVALPVLSRAPARRWIAGLGQLGIDLGEAVSLAPILLLQSGEAVLDVPVPSDPSLAGAQLFAQAVLVSWPGAARLTGVVATRIE